MTTVNFFINLVRQAGRSVNIKKAAEVVKTFVEEVVSEKTVLPNPQLIAPPPWETNLGERTDTEPSNFSAVEPAVPFAPSFPEDSAYHHAAMQEIDFSRQLNLDDYADELSLPSATLEGWRAAGILCPSETKVAEKLIRIIREKELSRATDSPEAKVGRQPLP